MIRDKAHTDNYTANWHAHTIAPLPVRHRDADVHPRPGAAGRVGCAARRWAVGRSRRNWLGRPSCWPARPAATVTGTVLVVDGGAVAKVF